MSLRAKTFLHFLGPLVFLTVSVCAVLGLLTWTQQHEEARLQGKTYVRLILHHAAPLILWDQRVALRDVLRRAVEADPVVDYAFVTVDGRPYVHTFRRGVPWGLLESTTAGGRGEDGVWEWEDGQGNVHYDVVARADEGEWAVHLGLAASAINRQVWFRVRRIILAGVLALAVGTGIAFLVSRRLAAEVERMMRALKASETRYRTLFDSSKDAVMTLTPEEGFLSGNPATLALFGCRSEEEFCACSPADLSPPNQYDGESSVTEAQRKMALALERGSLFFEWKHRRKDGTQFDATVLLTRFELDGKPYLQATVRDITQQKRVEEQLRKLSLAVEQCPVSVVITDTDGTIEYVNPKFTEVTGYTAEEAVGQNPRILKSGRTPETLYQELWQTITGGGVWRGEFCNQKRNGELYWEAVSISPIFDSAGRITHYVAVKEDITQRKATEEALRKKEEQLRQAQKMEAVGSLAGGIAHEFNNLLQAIRGYTQLAAAELDPQGQPYQDLQQALGAADRAATLTRQLLNFSRRDSIRPREISPNDVVREVEKMIRPLVGERIVLTTQLDPHVAPILADPNALHQALMNLCVNARDAMPSGGQLLMSTKDLAVSHEYAKLHPDLQPGRYVQITVADTGCGMSPEVKAKAFDPFFTTKEVGQGTGLGLAMVYGVIRRHEGSIHLYSEEGRGTTVRIYLPVIAQENEPKHPAQPAGGTETVLVADNDPDVRDLATRVLSKAGYTTIEARNGEEAIGLVRQQPQVALALVDVAMPEVDGLEACQRIKQLRPDLAVIVMSGNELDRQRLALAEGEGVELLDKPFPPELLLDKVRRVLDRCHSLVASAPP
ncbi:MAG TPA: PAS domain-containing sensor histidine kinase [Planctomycetaceae bacterium]|nr:PAS domain-containing sensor histidine kinase [Planctomycetaceae bacterium]